MQARLGRGEGMVANTAEAVICISEGTQAKSEVRWLDLGELR